jgi:hypothetical protein
MSTITVTNIKATGETASRAVSGVTAAWVNFNGQGTIAIRDSINVASLTDSGTGDYRVNFTDSMANINYSSTTGFTADSLGNGDNRWPTIITSVTTSYVGVGGSVVANGFNRIDKTHLFVTINGDLA